jgi:L-ascorbate metabolism protein UlaG (beta-lactamase superfamily)
MHPPPMPQSVSRVPPRYLAALLAALWLACWAAMAQSLQPDGYTLGLPAGRAAPVPGGSVRFIGNATVLIQYQGLCVVTDPNFLHRGERVHLGYGLTAERLTEPAIPLQALPPIDLVVLSDLHEDHFDQLVQQHLRHDVPIVTTKEAAERLGRLGFTQRYGLSRWDSLTVRKGAATLRITAMPARHGARAVAWLLPNVMGSVLDFAAGPSGSAYRIYISGDTVVYDGLAQIPRRFPDIDLALLHLGGARLLGMFDVSMDGADGVRMMRLIAPQRVIPLHTDDYDSFSSPLPDFTGAVREAGLEDHVIYLRQGDTYVFAVPARSPAAPGKANRAGAADFK